MNVWRKYRNYFCVSITPVPKRFALLNMISHGRQMLAILLLLAACWRAQAQSEYQIKTIVLDAGHGGHDSGCRGLLANEKEVTLSITLKVGELLKKKFPEIKVIYTRQKDEFIELYERANIANRNNADLFVSIHCNANKSHTPYGTETWLMGLHKSESNLEVSKRENDVILMEDDYQQNYDGFDPNSPEGYIILSMNQNAHLSQSIEIASKIEEQFSNQGRTSRGVKQAGFLVLWRTTMPAILIETGFLTNREEERYLISEKGQHEVSTAIVNAISLYKKEVEGLESGVLATAAGSGSNFDTGHGDQTQAKQDSSSASAGANITDKGVSKDAMIYRIQIAASNKPVNLKDPRYASFKDIANDKSDSGMNRYVVGNYSTLDECMNDLALIRKKGFKDAFVVAYKNGSRVPVN
jgi:N-acetylmuramoyl-L-alanine amidase